MRHHTDRNTLMPSAGAVALLMAITLTTAHAGFVPGGGNPAADCYAGLDVTGVTSTAGRIECTEGDPCDTGPCGDNMCTFSVRVCVNQAGVAGCTVPTGGLEKIQAPGPLKPAVPSSLTGASCGSTITLDLKLKKNGKANKRVLRTKATAISGTKPKKDQDSFLFMCKPRTGACPSSPSGAFVD